MDGALQEVERIAFPDHVEVPLASRTEHFLPGGSDGWVLRTSHDEEDDIQGQIITGRRDALGAVQRFAYHLPLLDTESAHPQGGTVRQFDFVIFGALGQSGNRPTPFDRLDGVVGHGNLCLTHPKDQPFLLDGQEVTGQFLAIQGDHLGGAKGECPGTEREYHCAEQRAAHDGLSMSHRTSWIKLFSSAGGTAGGIAPGAVGRG